jgi:hypothetical protein
MIMNIFQRIASTTVKVLGSIHWGTKKTLDLGPKEILRERLTNHYYIIVTRRVNHFSTFMTGIAHFFLTGHWGYWSHVLMNVEDEVHSNSDFRLVEALGTGVQYSHFDEVFSCTSVALLKPKHISLDEFVELLDQRAAAFIGRPYDTLFDLKQENAVSCVELIRDVLKTIPDYETKFANFERMIAKEKNLDPQMFYDCDDFEIVYEAHGS